jgi:iron complex outermembrane recepter protein
MSVGERMVKTVMSRSGVLLLTAAKHAINIPSGDLSNALDLLSKQSGSDIVYRPEQVQGLRTEGITGDLSTEDAAAQLIRGTSLTVSLDVTGAVLIATPLSSAQQNPTTHPASGDDVKEGKSHSSSEFRVARADQSVPAEAASLGSNTSASAQYEVPRVEEVVVTAQKRQERLQDVPVPVTSIPAATLLEGNQVRVQDFYATVPGFSVSPSPSGAGQQMLAIRGVTSGFNTNPTVGITVDDVPYGSSTNLAGNVIPDLDPNDLQRVEVLRGPQGTLYGASSMGGLLKFVTIDPSTDAVSGRVQAGTSTVQNGAELGYNVRAAANVPISDGFAIRVSGFTRQDPGYIDNPLLSIDGVNEERVSGGRLATLWRPSDRFSLKLSAVFQRTSADGANEVDALPGLTDLQQSYLRDIGRLERKLAAYSATATGKWGSVDLTSISGYNVSTFRGSADASYLLGGAAQLIFNVPGAADFADGRTSKFTEEVRAHASLGDYFEWLLGGFFTHESSPYSEDVRAIDPTTGAQVGDILYVPAPRAYTEYAGFADLTFHITGQFDIQLGGRESKIRQTSKEAVETGAVLGGASAVSPRVDSSANAFTYLVTPRYKITPDLMLYARLASGYRAGGPNYNPDPAVPHQFEPDKTQNYEIGAKGTLWNRLAFDASLYRIDWKDLQLSLMDAQNGLSYTSNASRAKSQGVEISFEARPWQGLRVAPWITWNEAVLTQSMPHDSAVAGQAGDRLPYGSRFSSNLALDQEFRLTGQWSASLGAVVSYVGPRLGTFVAAPLTREVYPAYTRTDLKAALSYGPWRADLYATNVADRRGLLGGGAGTFPPFAYSYIQPRTVGVSLSRDF